MNKYTTIMNIVNKFTAKRVSDAFYAERRDVDRHPMIHPFPSNMGRLDRYNYPGDLAGSPRLIFQLVVSSSWTMVSATLFLCSSFSCLTPRIEESPLLTAIETRNTKFSRSVLIRSISLVARMIEQKENISK
jgi:hypothetical protein